MRETFRTNPGRVHAGSGLVALLAVFALVLAFGAIRRMPPPPLPSSAPPGEFSSERAQATLRRLLAGIPPHPLGSPANGQLRQRLLASLRRINLNPQIQGGFHCNSDGTCGNVRNVVARLPGHNPGRAVLLVAHYDSVGASPGGGDDGAGVAILLEVVRALATAPPARNAVILLLDEGEEPGLLGAQVFAKEHPWAGQVRAVVNLESRGSSGPSLMFETGTDNIWMMRLFAGAVVRPVTSSVFPTLYKLLPNDTDFSVFKRHGLGGFNFAFIGDGAHYHTALDTVPNLSPATLQHQGENALAVVRALAHVDLGQRQASGEAVFFDLFAWRTVIWPVRWMRFLAILAIGLLGIDLAVLVRRGSLRPRALLDGLASWWGMVLATLLIALALTLLLWWAGTLPGPFTSLWIAHPLPAVVLFWLLALAITSSVSACAARGAGSCGLWAGTWIWWTLLGSLLAWTSPAASYPLLVPALVAGLAMLIGLLGGVGTLVQTALEALPAVAAALLNLPVLTLLYDGLGALALCLIATLVGVLATTVVPLVAAISGRRRWALPGGAGVGAALFLLLLFRSPTFSQDVPRPLNLIFYQNVDLGEAHWVVRTGGAISTTLRSAAAFGASPQVAFPWSSGDVRFYTANTAPMQLKAPILSILEQSSAGGRRLLRIRVSSPRGAPDLRLIVPKSVPIETVTVGGEPMLAPRGGDRRGRFRHLVFLGVPATGVEIEIVVGTIDKVNILVRDDSPGLPPAGEFLRGARSSSEVAFDEGDTTIVSRSTVL